MLTQPYCLFGFDGKRSPTWWMGGNGRLMKYLDPYTVSLTADQWCQASSLDGGPVYDDQTVSCKIPFVPYLQEVRGRKIYTV